MKRCGIIHVMTEREPLTKHHFLDGCPAIYPWLEECIHYNIPGALEKLVQSAIEDVRQGGKEHLVYLRRSLDAARRVNRRDDDDDKGFIFSPEDSRNSYLSLVTGWREPEASRYEFLVQDFGEEKARKLVEEEQLYRTASAAAQFLEAYNYEPLDVFEEGKEVKPILPEIPEATPETLLPLLRSCCDKWTTPINPWAEWSDSENSAVGSDDALVMVAQHYLGGDIIKVTKYMDDEEAEYDRSLPEGEEWEYDIFPEDYYFLELNGKRIDVAEGYSNFCEYAKGPVKSETVATKDEMMGDYSRAGRAAIIFKRLSKKV